MLEEYISRSVFDVFKKQFEIDIKEGADLCEKGSEFYCSSIDIIFKDGSKTILIYTTQPMLAQIAQLLLFEEDPDHQCLCDLNNEVANLVVGHAKVLASSDGYNFKIATPTFDGVTKSVDKTLCFKSAIGTLLIGLNDGR